jgi:long-chain acyl-CoA synthetase
MARTRLGPCSSARACLTGRVTNERPWLAHYAPGVPADVEVPSRSVVDILEASAERFPDHVALDFLGAQTSYADLWQQVLCAARALHDLGISAGDRVAIVLPNCPQHVVAFYAALRLGAVVVEHNPLYTADELARQLVDHSPALAIAWDVIAPTVATAAPAGTQVIAVDVSRALPLGKRIALRLPVKKARATRAALTARAPGLVSWHRLVADAPALDPRVPGPTGDDIALLQYTGGTTGVPKGAMLTHRNLVANATQSLAWAPGLVAGNEVFYGVLPFFHAYGLTLCLTTAILCGATVVLFPRFDPDQVLDAMVRVPATFLPGVPPMYPRLAERAAERGVSLKSVRYAIAGAMALPPETIDQWEAAGAGLLVEGYGMTESSPITLGNPLSTERRAESIGIPFPSTWIRVALKDDPTTDVAPGDPGELLVSGPQVFVGYWNRPEETAAALLPGGWLRTGDVVVVDDDGFVHLVDRIKELVIVGGFNVYPSEVEAVLRRQPGVADAAVVALPHGDIDHVAAAVVAEPGVTLDTEALIAACRKHLAGYKTPRRIEVVDELPRSTIGKVLRSKVRDMLLADTPAP